MIIRQINDFQIPRTNQSTGYITRESITREVNKAKRFKQTHLVGDFPGEVVPLELKNLKFPEIPYARRNLAGKHVSGNGQDTKPRQIANRRRQLAAAKTSNVQSAHPPVTAARDAAPAAETGKGAVGPTGEKVQRVGRDSAFKAEKGQCIVGKRRVEGICVMGSEEEEEVKETTQKKKKKMETTHVGEREKIDLGFLKDANVVD